MKISDEAVDAASRAIHRYDWAAGLSSTFAPNAHHREEARLALEAATPHMLAHFRAQIELEDTKSDERRHIFRAFHAKRDGA